MGLEPTTLRLEVSRTANCATQTQLYYIITLYTLEDLK